MTSKRRRRRLRGKMHAELRSQKPRPVAYDVEAAREKRQAAIARLKARGYTDEQLAEMERTAAEIAPLDQKLLRRWRQRRKVQDEAVENWLRQEVTPAYDAMKAGPSRGRSVADVRASLAAERERVSR